MSTIEISKQTLQRLPYYLHYLRSLQGDIPEFISATTIAEALNLNHVQVRKDLASISTSGRPKVGYRTQDLVMELTQFLGYGKTSKAIIVGAGKLGQALLAYQGFQDYGMDILAAFDANVDIPQISDEEKPIYPVKDLPEYCQSNEIAIGIITVPAEAAQDVCNNLISVGILAIWNFAPVHLSVPEHILVQNENMASSLAVLSNHLNKKLAQNTGS